MGKRKETQIRDSVVPYPQVQPRPGMGSAHSEADQGIWGSGEDWNRKGVSVTERLCELPERLSQDVCPR